MLAASSFGSNVFTSLSSDDSRSADRSASACRSSTGSSVLFGVLKAVLGRKHLADPPLVDDAQTLVASDGTKVKFLVLGQTPRDADCSLEL